MKHLIINNDTCVGCSLCKNVCIRDNIEIIDKKAVEIESNCFDCGHCSSICPTNSIILKKYEDRLSEIESFNPNDNPVSYENLLNFYKRRRSIRWFKNEKIDKETFNKLLKGAYYSPNRQNIQDVEFVVIDNDLEDFISHVYDIIKVKEDEFFRIKHVGEYLRNPDRDPNHHPLLWEGKQILLAFSENKNDAVISMTRIELLAYSLGLGGFYSLFIGMADEINHEKLMEFFPEIDSNKHMYAVFIIGIPRVKYLRTRQHDEIKLTYKLN